MSGEAPDPAAIEFGRKLFAQECTFRAGATRMDNLPPMRLPEIAFAGRSNVGKSSLLNALVGRVKLARVSNTPGRTREVNFFDLGEAVTLVDLPGYGYARIERKLADQWTKTIFAYLRGRQTLKRAVLLIDGRHGIKDSDEEAMKALDEAAVSFQIVLTKGDKPKRQELDAVLARTRAEAAKHPAAHPVVLVTSSETGEGIPELRAALAQLAEPKGLGYKPATSQPGGA